MYACLCLYVCIYVNASISKREYLIFWLERIWLLLERIWLLSERIRLLSVFGHLDRIRPHQENGTRTRITQNNKKVEGNGKIKT